MDIQTWQIVVALLGTSGLSTLITAVVSSYRERQNAKAKTSDASIRGQELTHSHYEKILDRYQKEIDLLSQYKKDFDDYRIKVEAELDSLRTKINLLESAHYDLPLPMWLKDVNGVILSVNDAFEREILAPVGAKKKDYIGVTDTVFWPKFAGPKYGPIYAGRFTETDKHVIATGETYDGIEGSGLPGDKIEPVRVIKYPRSVGGVLIGVGGIALPQKSVGGGNGA